MLSEQLDGEGDAEVTLMDTSTTSTDSILLWRVPLSFLLSMVRESVD